MKISTIFFSLLLLFFISIPKNNDTDFCGRITFKYQPNEINPEQKKDRDKIFSELDEQSKDITFVLSFNDKESFFSVEQSMDNDLTPIALSYANTIISKGKYYTNIEEKIVLRKYNALGEDFLISSKINALSDWNLTKESKNIGQFLCFKATKNTIIENSKGKHNFDIVAWYSPEIPVKYGPKNYNNLPGMILELKDSHFTFYADKIEILKKKDVKIERFKGKSITESDFKNKIKEVTGQIIMERKN